MKWERESGGDTRQEGIENYAFAWIDISSVGCTCAESEKRGRRRNLQAVGVEECVALIDKCDDECVACTRKDIVIADPDVEYNVGGVESHIIGGAVGDGSLTAEGGGGKREYHAVRHKLSHNGLQYNHNGVASRQTVDWIV